MHVPDALMCPYTSAVTGAISLAAAGFGVYQVRRGADKAPGALAAVTAAGVFAAQMLNFQIPGGTSGHLIGGVLAAALLGPWKGLLAITCVLLVQCALFADGGATALGANVLNMGIVGSLAGYAIYSFIRRSIGGTAGLLTGAGIASWLVTVLAAVCCSIEISAGTALRVSDSLGAMLPPHAWIGAGEAVITVAVLFVVHKLRPALLTNESSGAAVSGKSLVIAGLAVAMVLAVFASPFASSLPDGLERSLEHLGATPGEALLPAPFPDYTLPAIRNLPSALGVAGGIGTIVVFAIGLCLPRRKRGCFRPGKNFR